MFASRSLFISASVYFSLFCITAFPLLAQTAWERKFEQLGNLLPTPNTYRTASGAPGTDYWQQRADYQININLDDQRRLLQGQETITYYNNSPDVLRYIWVQLDQNLRADDSSTPKVATRVLNRPQFGDSIPASYLGYVAPDLDYRGGYTIASVLDAGDRPLSYTVNQTMMRIDLPSPLYPGAQFRFQIAWSYAINNRMRDGGRSGYEYFPKDDNYVYTIAQFYPRVAVYDDVEGWQHKQFLGRGEFALSFGDFEVNITVPSDHIVASTGELQNEAEALTTTQLERLRTARASFKTPVLIVTEKEARKNERSRAKDTKTWQFRAENVRDFAFATSRKFIWDAMAVDINGKRPLAMSFYPKEGNPLWEQESTLAVARTLRTYSKFTIDYPYPVAISVHAASIGMEYPMICFNFGRPAEDGSYSDQVKWRMIGVIVHEVGHNFFPMIISSDERQWTWMDEGLNSFVESLTEAEYYPDLPLRRGPPSSIVNYMKGDKQRIRPIMINSEQILQFGNNAYGKPAAALTLLRETVMGRELFDYAFKVYADRWAFKHPTPADFFRTMEDASGVDLDWFWRGWFYTTDHVDISIDNLKWYRIQDEKRSASTPEPQVSGQIDEENPLSAPTKVFTITESSPRGEFRESFPDQRVIGQYGDKNFYEATFSNQGGLVSPLVIRWNYTDNTSEIERIPAEVWRMNEQKITKLFIKDKQVRSIELDPLLETADVETQNNTFPRKAFVSDLEAFKARQSGSGQ